MPLYAYQCAAGHRFERLLPLARYAEPQVCELCNMPAEKILTPVMVRGDYAGYTCPITGDWVEGRKAHRENLRKHGCRVLEPGETNDVQRTARRREEQLEDAVADTAASLVAQMPQEKVAKLAQELASGADISFERHG